MVGHTRDEQRLLTALAGDLGGITPDRAREDTEAFPDPGQRHEVVRSDWLFRTPSLKLAEAQVSAGGSAHLYELTWEAPGMGGALGACHGLDVPLVFGNLTAGQPAVLLGGPTVEAVELSALMRAAWVGFATTGDPGWPGFDTGAVRLFDLPPVTTAYPEQVSREIWTDPPGALDLLAAP
jgi:para-nitrobenzyl esterase